MLTTITRVSDTFRPLVSRFRFDGDRPLDKAFDDLYNRSGRKRFVCGFNNCIRLNLIEINRTRMTPDVNWGVIDLKVVELWNWCRIKLTSNFSCWPLGSSWCFALFTLISSWEWLLFKIRRVFNISLRQNLGGNN